MNVVVSCDHILERDSSIPIVEEVVENLVPTQIFTRPQPRSSFGTFGTIQNKFIVFIKYL